MNLFLDLEETVIDDWFSGVFLHHKMENMKSMIRELEKQRNDKFDHLVVFSFAITSDRDVDHFNLHFKEHLESFFEIKVNTVFKSDNKNLFKLAKSAGLDVLPGDLPSDVFNGNLKQEAFEAFALKHHRNEFSLLFDDVVSNSHNFLFNNKNKPFEFNGKLEKSTETMTVRV